MKKYVFQKGDEFLKEDGTFTKDVSEAKEYKLKFWIQVLQILIQLLTIFGSGKLKRVG